MLRRRDVEARTGLGRSAIYKLMKAGTFPAQIKLGIGVCVAWSEDDINEWITRQLDNGRNILTKSPDAAENFLRAQLKAGPMPEPILRTKADSYAITWVSIEQARGNGIVTAGTVNGMTAPRWSLVSQTP